MVFFFSEFSLVMQENKIPEALNYDIDVSCVVQWEMLWYSAPTSRNHDSLNDGVILAKCNATIKLAVKESFILSLWRRNTPRACFLPAHCLTMTGMPQWVWTPERDGILKEDLTYCLRMKTTDRTLNLMYSQSHATDQSAAAI